MRTRHALGVLAFLAFSGMVQASTVDVTVSVSKSTIGIGETATLTVYGQVNPGYATSGNGIFGWDVDLRIGDPTILGLLPATLDRSGWTNNPSTSSSGTVKSWGLDAIYDTGESSSTLGLTSPVKLFSIDFRALKAGTTTLAVQPDATTGIDFLTWQGNTSGDYSRASIAIAAPATLLWTGSIDNKWNVGQTANWSAGGTGQVYREGDHVTFDNAGDHLLPVDVTATVNPGSLLVNNSTANVVLGGIGSVAGPCKLTKTGNATLTLTGGNTYTGGTTVSGGTLLVANTSGSGTGTGAVTVGAATLGGTGYINGPVTLTGDSTLTSTGTLTINNTLIIQGLANQLASGTVLTSGDVTIDPGAVFIINGTLGGDGGSLIVRGTLMGKGTINKICIIEAGGVLSPGAPSSIQTFAQVRAGLATKNFSFEIAEAAPNYASPSNSINDVIRLADADTPFADATGSAPAALTADTVIDVYFLSADPALGAYKAEFFAATDFSDAVAEATYQYWRLDPRGSRYHNGNLYSPLDAALVDWSVVPETATFNGQATSGYITEFTVVPEPATLGLLALGGLLRFRYRRR